jgi:predicted O-linked N-acetylglucosamine transferase (SPINDLY family)
MADKSTRDVVEEGFAKEGIPAGRLVLAAQQVNLPEHFAYYGNVDLALDTFSYCGTTTTCEAMWMNVPVVTLAGTMHISRVGASLLTNVGLESLIANTEDQFVEIAARLARDPAALAAVRKGLRSTLQASPLMNQKQFAADFGDALRTMWRDWCATQPSIQGR